MPTESSYPKLDIPNVDLWAFLFERKDREFPDDKGMQFPLPQDAIFIELIFVALLLQS
jgi:hypothetical protein